MWSCLAMDTIMKSLFLRVSSNFHQQQEGRVTQQDWKLLTSVNVMSGLAGLAQHLGQGAVAGHGIIGGHGLVGGQL